MICSPNTNNSSQDIPLDVERYLRLLRIEFSRFAYIGLDRAMQLRCLGGEIRLFGCQSIDRRLSIFRQVPLLEGMIPTSSTPVVIRNAQNINDCYFDLHLFTRGLLQWAVILDNYGSGKELQSQQQARLRRELFLQNALAAKK